MQTAQRGVGIKNSTALINVRGGAKGDSFGKAKTLTQFREPRDQSYDEKNYETGIIRVPIKDGYNYFYVKDNKKVSDKDLKRILSLKLPPAWNNVWISGNARSDIQAVGVDSKGRKQYKYNEKHALEAEHKKFIRLYDFLKQLPKLNRTIGTHSRENVYNINHVIATMLKLVQALHMRVGKEQYAKENKSYGISSLKKTHVKIDGDTIRFRFKGKSNQMLSYTTHDKLIAEHINLLLKLEGEKLFQYIDTENKIKRVDDMDLNNYIQTYMGKDFTIKDFRTYAANYYFVKALLNETRLHGNNIKKNILNAVKVSAKHLSHTKSISKKAYIMSFCIDLYTEHPEFFISRKYEDANNVLEEILKLYKKSIKS